MPDDESALPSVRRAPRRISRRLLVLIGGASAVLSASLAFAILTQREPSRPAGRGAGRAGLVTAAPVPTSVRVVITRPAQVVVTPGVVVVPPQPGWIRSVRVKKGQAVRAGSVIAVLEPVDESSGARVDAYQAAAQELAISRMEVSTARTALETAQAGAAAAEASLSRARAGEASARADVDRARSEESAAAQALRDQDALVARNQEMFGQGIISRRELQESVQSRERAAAVLDQARSAAQEAEAGVQAAGDQLSAAQAAVEQAKAGVVRSQSALRSVTDRARSQEQIVAAAVDRLRAARSARARLPLTSPLDGVVADLPVAEGALVTPAMAVARVDRPAAATVAFGAREDEVADVRAGMPATVTALGKRSPMDGRVAAVTPTIGGGDKRSRVFIQVRDAARILKPGTSVSARIPLRDVTALAVPRSAIVRSGGETFTQILVDGRARRRQVEVVGYSGGRAMIDRGITPDDQVVLP